MESVVRAATPADLAAVTEALALAFHDDPTWSWAFPDAALRQGHHELLWRLMVGAALRYPWVLVTEDCGAAAVWLPPGASELSPADGARLPRIVQSLVGERADEVMELFALFEEARPAEPHYYRSLLGTHPARAGKGLGMALVEKSLRRIDLERLPAYLESRNSANNSRYERCGFEATGTFTPPGSDVPVTTMWRNAR